MKVIDIKKHYRNGTKQHYLVLFGESFSDDTIDEKVSDWCESEPSGLTYGYSYDWNYVEDKDTIINVLHNEKLILNQKITKLINDKNSIDIFIYNMVNKKPLDDSNV